MMNQNTECLHPKLSVLDATDKLIHHTELAASLEQQFPATPATEIDAIIHSDDFEHAYCPDCKSFLMRLA